MAQRLFRWRSKPDAESGIGAASGNRFALRLCAIGAGRLAFVSDTPLDAGTAAQAAADIVSLYADAPSNAADRFAAWLSTHDTLLIRYTES
ncbi:MAG: hypothetical protein B7Y97_09110 [Sphingomonas sp. 32-66-10]|nr:MAG: hypothetical protein B7Y97_09110 [Sphingomonas sp. 32-66-10]